MSERMIQPLQAGIVTIMRWVSEGDFPWENDCGHGCRSFFLTGPVRVAVRVDGQFYVRFI